MNKIFVISLVFTKPNGSGYHLDATLSVLEANSKDEAFGLAYNANYHKYNGSTLAIKHVMELENYIKKVSEV